MILYVFLMKTEMELKDSLGAGRTITLNYRSLKISDLQGSKVFLLTELFVDFSIEMLS